MNDIEIQRLIIMEKKYAGGTLKWKNQKKSKRCDCVLHANEIEDGYFILYARQNEIDPDNFSCGLKLVRSGKDDLTLLRYNGSAHQHTNVLEREFIDYECHIHIATERYANSGYKIDHYATRSNEYSDLSSAIKCLIDRSNIHQLTLSDFITQEGFSFD